MQLLNQVSNHSGYNILTPTIQKNLEQLLQPLNNLHFIQQPKIRNTRQIISFFPKHPFIPINLNKKSPINLKLKFRNSNKIKIIFTFKYLIKNIFHKFSFLQTSINLISLYFQQTNCI